jgi:KaiC/GvpD/RAD55 family RecA-like ATPase
MVSHTTIAIVLSIATLVVLPFVVPPAQAQTPSLCTLQISGMAIPATAQPGQNIPISTHLSIACGGTTQYLLARVNISQMNSTSSLSESSVGLGTDVTPRTWNISLLNSIHAPPSTGTWDLTAHAWVFASTLVVAESIKSFQIQIVQPGTITTRSMNSTSTSPQMMSTTAQTSPLVTSTTQTTSFPTNQLGLAGIVVVLLAASVVLGKRRKQPATLLGDEQVTITPGQKPIEQASRSILTGYNELDLLLGGGLPEGYSVLILSEPCDEMDLIIRKLIQSTISQGYSVFFVSRDVIKTQHLIGRYPNNFYAFNPMADKMPTSPNLFKISGVENLSDLNISLGKAMEPLLKETSNRLLILDVISDALLEHKGLTTRKWLNDFIAKRKADGFTILGIFNPNMVWKADAQAIIDLFDGVIEVFEKGLRERARRFLIIKRMYGRKYAEKEIMLDREKLHQAEDRDDTT